MKLLNLTGQFYALSVAFIIFFGGFVSYEILKSYINKQFNQQLLREKEQLIYELNTYDDIREVYYLNIGDRIDIETIENDDSIEPYLSDTTMYDTYAEEELQFRQFVFSTLVDDKNYRVTISKSLLPTEELIEGVGETMLIILAGLLLALLLANRYLSKRIWDPFYEILNILRSFDITQPLFRTKKAKTNVDEFAELNEAINEILERNKKDYLNLKEFTDNASHEIQTPLAIIKSKSELLMQSSAMAKEDLAEIKNIYDSVLRLSQLNKSLIILTKIENNQFITSNTVNIASLIDEILSIFSELIEFRNLKVTKKYLSNPKMIINEDLAYTLFSNLIKNSIKHNLENGFISISVSENEVVLMNSGPAAEYDPKEMFNRFKKGKSSGSPGLGLALVKKICDSYDLQITYSFSESIHKIQLGI